jgi:hypothetical protein
VAGLPEGGAGVSSGGRVKDKLKNAGVAVYAGEARSYAAASARRARCQMARPRPPDDDEPFWREWPRPLQVGAIFAKQRRVAVTIVILVNLSGARRAAGACTDKIARQVPAAAG